MTCRALVAVADGSEDIETVAIIDVLRRANVQVTVAAVGSPTTTVHLSRGCALTCDSMLISADTVAAKYDAIVLPGGMPGAERLRDSDVLTKLLRDALLGGTTIVAAICAAPAVVLLQNHLISAANCRQVTSHPNFAADFAKMGMTGMYSEQRVVVDGKIITSRGPGTAIEFAVEIVQLLLGPEVAQRVAAPMLIR
jgi:4-methyl-5(b-hydroxyethyl)-thiazole monophosphate biosynthesis